MKVALSMAGVVSLVCSMLLHSIITPHVLTVSISLSTHPTCRHLASHGAGPASSPRCSFSESLLVLYRLPRHQTGKRRRLYLAAIAFGRLASLCHQPNHLMLFIYSVVHVDSRTLRFNLIVGLRWVAPYISRHFSSFDMNLL